MIRAPPRPPARSAPGRIEDARLRRAAVEIVAYQDRNLRAVWRIATARRNDPAETNASGGAAIRVGGAAAPIPSKERVASLPEAGTIAYQFRQEQRLSHPGTNALSEQENGQGTDQGEITQLLEAVRNGQPLAHEALMGRVYLELKGIARRNATCHPRTASYQTTALVNEAYVRLFGKDEPPQFESRGHFFWAASRAMRDLLVERARARQRLKRGGGARHIPLEHDTASVDDEAEEVLAINEALAHVEHVDARAARVFTLRFFGGLQESEVADMLGVSNATVRRDWALAKTLLRKQLADRQVDPS